MTQSLLTTVPHAPTMAWMPGFGEWIVILVIVLVIFGPGKLPLIGDALGKGIRNFKRSSSQSDEIDVTPPQLDEGQSSAGKASQSSQERHPQSK